jgi:hypothetical protein
VLTLGTLFADLFINASINNVISLGYLPNPLPQDVRGEEISENVF